MPNGAESARNKPRNSVVPRNPTLGPPNPLEPAQALSEFRKAWVVASELTGRL
jgi:hypothetical protein